MMKRTLTTLLTVSLLSTSVAITTIAVAPAQASCKRTSAVIVIRLGPVRHKAVIAHANAVIKKYRYPQILVLNRPGAAARRAAALRGIPTKPGHDRDEYPPVIGRKVNKAHVYNIPSSQNRSAGAIMGNTLRPYCNGTKFRYAYTVATPKAPTSKPKPPAPVYYANCTAVRDAGKAPIYRGQPGYGSHLDRDGDGVGCE